MMLVDLPLNNKCETPRPRGVRAAYHSSVCPYGYKLEPSPLKPLQFGFREPLSRVAKFPFFYSNTLYVNGTWWRDYGQ
jgi:hypothetical protein